jgi:MoxR-like ATPase
MSVTTSDPRLDIGRRLSDNVLGPLKAAFVGKDEVIDLMGVCLVAGEHLFLHGPPGTAKSALVQELAGRLEGQVFDYLLTRFTEPSELFGPFDIRRLREGELVTNTEGMLPEAEFVFLDELLNANSAVLNSLLMVLHERVFRRGRETRKLPLLMVVGASNSLPQDDALAALFDRFLMRVRCDNVPQEQLQNVLVAGWQLDVGPRERSGGLGIHDVRLLHTLLPQVDLAPVRPAYLESIHRLRHAGIAISDRRAVKLQRLMAASALLCGRMYADPSDQWVLRYIWDTEEQQEILASLVQSALDKAGSNGAPRHPRSRGSDAPDPESLARDLQRLAARFDGQEPSPNERSYIQDQLGVLAARCQWVAEEEPRAHLAGEVEKLWQRLGKK